MRECVANKGAAFTGDRYEFFLREDLERLADSSERCATVPGKGSGSGNAVALNQGTIPDRGCDCLIDPIFARWYHSGAARRNDSIDSIKDS